MKTITILFFTILLNACSSSKATTANLESKDSEPTNKTMQDTDDVAIEYSAITRGSFYVLKLNSKELSLQDDRNGKPAISAVSKDNWSTLMELVNTTDLKAMSEMKAPSEARFYDGAAIGQFKITKAGETYEVPAFDAGNPNEGVADLINKMLAIAKTKE